VRAGWFGDPKGRRREGSPGLQGAGGEASEHIPLSPPSYAEALDGKPKAEPRRVRVMNSEKGIRSVESC
jgi:hypothetical protein